MQLDPDLRRDDGGYLLWCDWAALKSLHISVFLVPMLRVGMPAVTLCVMSGDVLQVRIYGVSGRGAPLPCVAKQSLGTR